MTSPRFARVAEMVRNMIPHLRNLMSHEEADLAVHLRGNERLYTSLTSLINARIAGRAKVQEPTDPLVCKSMLARDRELQWLLGRLDFIYRSPVSTPEQDDEPS